jgi:hypothetical protein
MVKKAGCAFHLIRKELPRPLDIVPGPANAGVECLIGIRVRFIRLAEILIAALVWRFFGPGSHP